MEDTEPENAINKKKRTRGPTKQTRFPLPASHTSFDYHFEILKALNVACNNGTIFAKFLDVAHIAGIHQTTASKVLKFFFDIGLIVTDKRGTYKPKPDLVDFFNELQWNESGSGKIFGKMLIGTWFGEYSLQLFQMNKEIGKEDLIKKFGLYSLADHTNNSELTILVKLLEYGQIITKDKESDKYHLSYNDIPSKTMSSPNNIKNQQIIEERIVKISELEKNIPFDNPIKKEGSEISQKSQNQLSLNPEKISIPRGLFYVQVNVSIDENSDMEKIAEKILFLKKVIQ
jgi:hypothetical protein